MEWQPIETAPKDGTTIQVPIQCGYNRAFYQDGYWWWISELGGDVIYGPSVGPTPDEWMPDDAT